MNMLFTVGQWAVREGRADDFINLWQQLADWTSANVAGCGWAYLVRDREDGNRFVSFGPWETMEAVEAWRQSEQFQAIVGQIRPLLESFEPHTMTTVAHVGTGE